MIRMSGSSPSRNYVEAWGEGLDWGKIRARFQSRACFHGCTKKWVNDRTAAYLRETKAYVSTSKERGKQFSSLKYSQPDKQMAKQSFE